jgi:uncharacterized protein YqhQ
VRLPAPDIQAGGALLHGIWLQSRRWTVAAVRRSDGRIVVGACPFPPLPNGWDIPFLRGIVRMFAKPFPRPSVHPWAQEVMDAPLPDEGAAAASPDPVGEVIVSTGIPTTDEGSSVFAVALAAVLFLLVPQVLAGWASSRTGVPVAVASPGFQMATCVGMLTVASAYLVLIRRLEDIRRVFVWGSVLVRVMGACDRGAPLTVSSLRGQDRFHPYQDGAFWLVVMLVSSVLVAMVGGLLGVKVAGPLGHALGFLLKLLVLPVAVGVGWEVVVLMRRLWLAGWLVGPLRFVLLFQWLTASEPDGHDLETGAVAALTLASLEERSGVVGT